MMEAVPIPGAEIYYHRNFLSTESVLWRSRRDLHLLAARVQATHLAFRIALLENTCRGRDSRTVAYSNLETDQRVGYTTNAERGGQQDRRFDLADFVDLRLPHQDPGNVSNCIPRSWRNHSNLYAASRARGSEGVSPAVQMLIRNNKAKKIIRPSMRRILTERG